MSNKNLDPTLGALLISAITALILRIRVKVKKKSPEKIIDVSVDFEKDSTNNLNAKKK